MSLPPITLFPVIHLVGLDSGGSPVDVLLSTEWGRSAGTDTPASEPYLYILKPQQWVSWSAVDTSQGWTNIGGIADHRDYTFTATARRNTVTKTSPLDFLRTLRFKNQEAIQYACRATATGDARRWTVPDLADCTVVMRGTILDGQVIGDEFSVHVREQTKEGLDVFTTPTVYNGLARGVAPETGSTPTTGGRVVRPDVASIRGTGSQSFAWAFARLNTTDDDTGSASYIIFGSPVCRLQRLPGAGTVKAQMRNAAGTWQDAGPATSFPVSTLLGLLVSYDSSISTSEFFLDGVSLGTRIITSGLFAASAATTTWHNAPTVGTMEITWFHSRHETGLLDTADVLDRSLFVPPFTGLDMAIEFNRGYGTIVGDESATPSSALLTGFSDPDAAWAFSGTGEPGATKTRPRAVIGRPFLADLDPLDLVFQVYSPGYEALGASSRRFARIVTSDGASLASEISGSRLSSFDAANQQVTVFAKFDQEPSIGQILDVDTGANAGDQKVALILHDPIIGSPPLTSGTFVVDGSVTTESATARVWTGTGQWDKDAQSLMGGLSLFRVLSGVSDRMAACFNTNGSVDDSRRLAQGIIENLGPETAPTLVDIKVLSLEDVGWQGDGSAPALDQAPALARATPSTDSGPSVIYREGDGGWILRGSDRSPSSADFTFPERRIDKVDIPKGPARYKSVRVRYAKMWTWREGAAGTMPQAATSDRLASEASREWREVVSPVSGAESPELVIATFFLLASDAQAYADGILEILEDGALRKIQAYGPINEAEAAMPPFSAIDVTYESDPLLESGKTGILVALAVHDYRADIGLEMTVSFVD